MFFFNPAFFYSLYFVLFYMNEPGELLLLFMFPTST